MIRSRLLLALPMMLFAFLARAQAPATFNYQGVARDAQGDPLPNTTVSIRFRVHTAFPAIPGSLEYQENHTATTNEQGLFSLPVGGGNPGPGPNSTLATINWTTGTHYLEVQMDPAGGFAYVSLGAQLLRSVPYALHASTASGLSGGILSAGDLGLSSNGPEAAACAEAIGELTLSVGGGAVNAVDIAVVGTRVYLVNSADVLHVVDISEPETPILLGSLDLPSTGSPLVLANPTAISVDVIKDNRITSVDASNPAAMVEFVVTNASWGTITAEPTWLVGPDDREYLNTGTSLFVLGVCDQLSVTGYLDVALAGGLLCVGTATELRLVEPVVTVGSTCTFSMNTIGTIALPGGARRIVVRGNRAYALGNGFGYIIDISDPAAPVLLDSISLAPVPYVYCGLLGNSLFGLVAGSPTVEFMTIRNNGFATSGTSSYELPSVLLAEEPYMTPYVVAGAYWLTYGELAGGELLRVHRLTCNSSPTLALSGGTFVQELQENHWVAAGVNIYNSNLGSVGIGTTAPTATLSVNGTANNSSGSWSVFSDARVKKVNGPFTDGLNVIERLDPVRYTYTTDAPFTADGEQIGVIAQELEKAAPYMVRSSEGAGLSDLREVDNQAYVFLLINAVQELSAKVHVLEEENAAMKGREAQLREQLETNTKLLVELKGVLDARSER
jgi:hypothetical protein